MTFKRQLLEDKYEVEYINPGGPIDKSGRIAIGDKVVEVDGVHVDGLQFSDVCERLRGQEGSWVEIVFQRHFDDTCVKVGVERTPLRNLCSTISPGPRNLYSYSMLHVAY